jgi:hypothetical protein
MIDTVVERYNSNINKHQVPAKTQLRESEKHTATFILSLADMSKYKSDAQRRKEINGLKFRILDRNDALQMTVCINAARTILVDRIFDSGYAFTRGCFSRFFSILP